MADNVLAPLMDTPYSEIADAVIYDVVVREFLGARTPEFELAMRLLRPYMQDNPTLTVAQALEIMRTDKTAAQAATNHPLLPAGNNTTKE